MSPFDPDEDRPSFITIDVDKWVFSQTISLCGDESSDSFCSTIVYEKRSCIHPDYSGSVFGSVILDRHGSSNIDIDGIVGDVEEFAA